MRGPRAARDDAGALAAALEVEALRLACAPDAAPSLLRESLPLWALARYRNLKMSDRARTTWGM